MFVTPKIVCSAAPVKNAVAGNVTVAGVYTTGFGTHRGEAIDVAWSRLFRDDLTVRAANHSIVDLLAMKDGELKGVYELRGAAAAAWIGAMRAEGRAVTFCGQPDPRAKATKVVRPVRMSRAYAEKFAGLTGLGRDAMDVIEHSHADDKPYGCEGCNRSFKTLDGAKRHWSTCKALAKYEAETAMEDDASIGA